MVKKFLRAFSTTLNIVKIITFLLAVYFIVISLFVYFIKKDQIDFAAVDRATKEQTYALINDPKLQKTDQGKIGAGLYRATLCSFIGEGCTTNIDDEENNFNKSVMGYVSNFVISPYLNPPASASSWVRVSMAHAGFIPQAYAAQGIGFSAITPFMDIWKIFRNVSYTLLVLVVITIGFLIMFRANLGAQTIVTIENSLPRIIVAMLLITFSFPIAGFLIDMMYVLIGLTISVLTPLYPNGNESQLLNGFLTANLGTIWESVSPVNKWYHNIPLNIFAPLYDVTRIGNAIVSLFPPILNNAVRLVAALFLFSTVNAQLNQVVNIKGISGLLDNMTFLGAGLGKLPGGIIGFIADLLVYLIMFPMLITFGAGFIVGILILLTIVFLMFRIFFMLFFGYIRILMLIIFAPLILMLEAIPGQNSFDFWIRSLIGDLIMFPTVIVLLIVGRIIHSIGTPLNAPTAMWQPPFLYGINAEHFSVLVGIGIIFLIPDLVKALKEMIGAKGLPFNVGLGTYLSGAAAISGAGLGTVTQFGGLATSVPGFRKLLSTGPFGKIPGLKAVFAPEERIQEAQGAD